MNGRQRKAFQEASRRLSTVLLEICERDSRFVEGSAQILNGIATVNTLTRTYIADGSLKIDDDTNETE